MFGFQASGSAPLVRGEVVRNPDTIASAIRIGNPASWELALQARDETDGYFGAIDDDKILEAQRILSAEVGIFVEPASAISVATSPATGADGDAVGVGVGVPPGGGVVGGSGSDTGAPNRSLSDSASVVPAATSLP